MKLFKTLINPSDAKLDAFAALKARIADVRAKMATVESHIASLKEASETAAGTFVKSLSLEDLAKFADARDAYQKADGAWGNLQRGRILNVDLIQAEDAAIRVTADALKVVGTRLDAKIAALAAEEQRRFTEALGENVIVPENPLLATLRERGQKIGNLVARLESWVAHPHNRTPFVAYLSEAAALIEGN